MKTIAILVLCITFGFCLRVQAQLTPSQVAALEAVLSQTDPLPPQDATIVGEFYSAANPTNAPIPGNFNGYSVWEVANGVYLLDDFGPPPLNFGGFAMDEGPPAPGGTNGNGGSGGNSGFSFDFATNGLWLQITGITNGLISLNLNNATDSVYEVWSTTSLTNAAWDIEQEVWPTNQSCMPFAVSMDDDTNGLFFYARDWTGITHGGNTTPDWWFWEYFGTTALSDTNLDGQGNTLLSDYQQGVDPNPIVFWISSTGQYFNSSPIPLQLNLVTGVPFYQAILVDQTNFGNANWVPYAGPSVTVNAGVAPGWHQIWVGLRGLPATSQQTWASYRVNFNPLPPLLVITNPVAPTVMQPVIQIQGFCADPLLSLTYDLSNGVGVITNEPAFVVSQSYDTNGDIAAEALQAFDVLVTNGDNLITFHATDLAGNVTSTNFLYTLDYSGKTNPPSLQIFWPQNSAQISGDNLTLRGLLSDPTAGVTAQFIDQDGNTNTVEGVVERDGVYWISNVSLASGLSSVSLTVTDVVGNVFSTNISLLYSNSALTIDDFSASLGQTSIPSVTGTITASGYVIWVNGVQANQNNGVWQVTSVPVSSRGVAVVQARAIPIADNDGNGICCDPPTDGTPGNPNGPGSITVERDADQPPRVFVQSYSSQSTSVDSSFYMYATGCPETVTDTEQTSFSWTILQGATNQTVGEFGYSNCDAGSQSEGTTLATYPADVWPPLLAGTEISTNADGTVQTNSVPALSIPIVEWSEGYHAGIPLAGSFPYALTNDFSLRTSTSVTLSTGGKGIAQSTKVIQISANGTASLYQDNLGNWITQPVPSSQITLLGIPETNNNSVYIELPSGVCMDATPIAPYPRVTYPSEPAIPIWNYFTGITVLSGASPISTNNDWGVIQQSNTYAVVQASLVATNLMPYLKWNTGYWYSGPVTQRRVLTEKAGKVTVTASMFSQSISLNLWVIWADVSIGISGALNTNDAADVLVNGNWPTPTTFNVVLYGGSGLGGGNYLGAINRFTNSDLNYAYAIGKIEAQVTLHPTGIGGLLTNWQILRQAQAIGFDNGTNSFSTGHPPAWVDDTSSPSSQFLPSVKDMLFDLDTPTCPLALNIPTNHTSETYDNFYDYVTVNLNDGAGYRQCSSNAPLSYQCRIDFDLTTNQVQLNSLSAGNVVLPTNAYYSPR